MNWGDDGLVGIDIALKISMLIPHEREIYI